MDEDGDNVRRAWVLFLMIFIAGVAFSVNMFKIAPFASDVMSEFGVSIADFGQVSSAFYVTGVFVSCFAAVAVGILGLRRCFLVALACLSLGSFFAALADSWVILLACRCLEGIGVGLVEVAAPSGIVVWFPRGKRSLPMGIWSTWMGAGSLLTYNLAPIATGWAGVGWRSVWWFSFALAVLAFVLVAVGFRPQPERGAKSERPQGRSSSAGGNSQDIFAKSGLFGMFRNGQVVLLGIMFFLFNLTIASTVKTYYPLYLYEECDYGVVAASEATGLLSLLGLFFNPLVGAVGDRMRLGMRIVWVSCLGLAALFPLAFGMLGETGIWAFLLVAPLLSSLVVVTARTIVPDLPSLTPETASEGMAMLSLFRNLGMFVGPLLFGAIQEGFGWTIAGAVYLPASLGAAALVAAVLARRLRHSPRLPLINAPEKSDGQEE